MKSQNSFKRGLQGHNVKPLKKYRTITPNEGVRHQ